MRRASWSAEPSATIRPPARIRIRSASFSASARSWVVSSTVVPSRSVSRCTSSWNSRGLRVEPGGRLVEEQQLRAADDPDRDVQAAALPARQGDDPLVRRRAQADHLDQLVGRDRASAGVGREGCVVGAEVVDQVPGCPPGVVTPRLQHDADPGPPGLVGVQRIGAEHLDRPRRGTPEALQDLDRGGLAGAVGAEQDHDLAERWTSRSTPSSTSWSP
jgi:hypothetical protein